MTTDIGAVDSDAMVLRASGSTVERPGYMAATKDQDDLESSTVASTLGRELQACYFPRSMAATHIDADLP